MPEGEGQRTEVVGSAMEHGFRYEYVDLTTEIQTPRRVYPYRYPSRRAEPLRFGYILQARPPCTFLSLTPNKSQQGADKRTSAQASLL